MFKRRDKRTYTQIVTEGIYPRGGWSRAISYVMHRLRRLPDPPHKISRGIAAGVFVCFTPIFGFHFVLAAALAYVMQGNILAALLATFFGNPITFPFIATISMEMGQLIFGTQADMSLHEIFAAFSNASVELWHNLSAVFTDDTAHWGNLRRFFWRVFMPYLVGGLVPGTIAGVAAYAISRPLIDAYQRARIKRMKKRYEKRRLAESHRADAAQKTS